MRPATRTLIAIVMALLALGIVMLASTSSVKGAATYGDPHHFVKRQLIWIALAALGGFAIARFDYHWWQRWSVLSTLYLVAIILLILVFVPPIGQKVGGSNRWLRVGPLSFQPSELAKFAVIVVLSAWMVAVRRRVKNLKEGLLIPLAGLSTILALLILEPDFGTTLLTGAVGMVLMFVGGTRIGYLVVSGVLGLCAFVVAVMHDPVRMTRVLAFLMPEKYPDQAYHLAQSKVAFIRGGWFGVGLGNSIQKQFYLPEAHTDFILAIIGEELGFLATLGVVLLFVGILACGLYISARAPDAYGRLLAFGFTLMLVLQAAINLGVVTGCLPTKGLPLPFISYGGSSVMMSIACIAVLLNVARHVDEAEGDVHTRTIRDRAHRF